VPNVTQLSVVQPSTLHLSEVPVLSIDALLNRELGPWTNAPVHINGAVNASVPGELLVLKDPTGLIRARVLQATEVAAGDRLDLWGYLEAAAEQPILADAYFEADHSGGGTVKAPAPGPELTNGTAKIVSTVAELRTMSRDRIASGVPVRIRGALLYSDPEWHLAFVHDGRAAVYAEVTQPEVCAGQFVELTGRATLAGFGLSVLPARFQVLGVTNLPAPLPADLSEVADGSLDAQWVEMRGVVRRAIAEWGHLHLSVMTRQGNFNVIVPGFAFDRPPDGLLDSRVAVRGVCGSDVNARNQVSGITLYSPSLQQVQTLQPAPKAPFAAPATPIAAVATFDPGRVSGGRVKVAGVVTLNVPGRGLYLQDESGGIHVHTPLNLATDVRPGDRVEVLGFPALGEFSPLLEEPIINNVRVGLPPAPVATTAEKILLRGTNEAMLVRLEAKLLQPVARSAQPKLIFQEGSVIFTAQLVRGRLPENVSHWRPGSVVRLTGLCTIQGAEDHSPQSFRILIPDPSGLALLQAPPVWTLREFLVLGGILGFVGLTTLSWIFALRRRVRAGTADLRASQATLQRQLEHTHTLSELGRRLNAAATPKDAALIIVEVADRLIGWDCCVFDLYSAETDLMTHVLNMDIVEGRRTECQPRFIQLPVSALARRAIVQGPQLILRESKDLGSAEGICFGDTARRSASILYVPICDGAVVIGVLSIQSYAFRAYDEGDLVTLAALADHCSGTLVRIRAHQQLVELSRQTGMTEVATGVLHNVGNVLNSVNVSVTLLLERIKDSNGARLVKITDLLREHSSDLGNFVSEDPKGRKIPAYLEQLAAVVTNSEGRSRAELEALAKNVDHIKEIVAMQQSYARVAGVVESVPAAEFVEDALRLNAGTLSRHQVEVCRDYAPDLPSLCIDKHKVLQILTNLIRNAKYACDESGRLDKKLTVSIVNGSDLVRISVADNGVGIAPEHLTRIFSHGFSTRKDGHGFGLHSGALAAKELGGTLTAHSDGPGAGATFTLELPLSHTN